MDREIISFGPFSLYYYSLFIFLGIIAGGSLVYFELAKEKIEKEDVFNLFFYTIIFAFLGARGYYVLFNLTYYFNNPLEIFAIWHGGLAIHGGMLGAIGFLIYYQRKKKINLLKLFDVLVIGLIIGQVIGRWGNFFNSEAYGSITSYNYLKSLYIPEFIIKGMYIEGVYYLPTFFFESVWNLGGFIILLLIRKFYKGLRIGQLTGFYLVWYSFIRFIIEGMRLDSLMIGSLKVAQLVSVIMFVIGVYFLFLKKSKLYKEGNVYE